jgi:hypothetical protein
VERIIQQGRSAVPVPSFRGRLFIVNAASNRNGLPSVSFLEMEKPVFKQVSNPASRLEA